jgi:hypothetical protein
VIGEINSLVTSETLAVLPGVKVEVVLGGDYKVNMRALINVHKPCFIFSSFFSWPWG